MSIISSTSNPVSRSVIDEYMQQHNNYTNGYNKRLTKQSAAITTMFLLIVVIITTACSIYLGFKNPLIIGTVSMIGCFGVIAMGFITVFNKNDRQGSSIAAIIFSIFEGMMLGGITFRTGTMQFTDVNGWSLVGQAILASVCLFFVALFSYSTGIIKATPGFMKAVGMGCAAFGLMYLVNFGITLFTGTNLLYSQGPIPMIISIVAIIFATLSVIGELKILDDAVMSGAQSRMKWSIATGFMTSIVWMYIEVLRLLTLVNRD